MTPELRQLRHFVTVAEELHFGRAAARLHMTQPPLSQSIAGLEELLGAPLFLRNRRQVTLTPAGSAMLPEARRILEEAGALPELVRRIASGEAGRLGLSFVTTAGLSVLPAILRRYSAAYPAVRMVLQEATSDVQFGDLLQGRIGNFINAELPGRVADASLPWAMEWPNAVGLRHPSPLYQCLVDGVLVFLILWPFARKARPRLAVGALFTLLYGCARFFTEYFRVPDWEIDVAGIPITSGQMLSLPMIIAALVMLAWAYKQPGNRAVHA